MGLESVHEMLEKLNATSKVNEKLALLEQFIQDPLFLKTVRYALHPAKMYQIKKLPLIIDSEFIEPKNPDKEIFKFLKKLAKQTGTTDKDKVQLSLLTHRKNGYSAQVFEVVSRIVKKDLRCGVSTALINRVRPGTIPVIPYMRCTTNLDTIVYPCYSQLKANQMFCNLIITDIGKIRFLARSGQKIRQLKKLKKIIFKGIHLEKRVKNPSTRVIKSYYKPKEYYTNRVYTGELLVRKNGKILSREEGNGILSQCIKGTADPKDLEDVVFRVWDCIPYDKWKEGKYAVVYRTRFFSVQSFCNNCFPKNDIIEPIESIEVKNKKELMAHYHDVRKRKEEGTIAKNLMGEWEDTKSGSKDQVKVKNETEAELIITDIYCGDKGKKYEKCLGGLKCETAEGIIKVDVGGGFSDKQRGYYPIRNKKGGITGIDEGLAKKTLKYWESKKGEIVSVIFEGFTKDKRTKQKSLYLPRFVEERPDRTDADMYKMLKAKVKGQKDVFG